DGYKLKGSWVLVRTGGRYPGARGGSGNARSWLLIKHRDNWAGDLDITEFAPRSVKSDGDFEDILGEDMPAVWLSNRPAKGGEAGGGRTQRDGRSSEVDLRVNALVFDTFGTVVDYRSSIIAEGEALGRVKGIRIDWAKFADAWRGGYAPAMNRVRKGELPWTP